MARSRAMAAGSHASSGSFVTKAFSSDPARSPEPPSVSPRLKLGAAALVCCLVLAWPAVRIWQTRLLVTDLCDGAVVGAWAAEQESKARASGLDVMSWQDPKPGRPATISASGGVFFFRWVCVVEHAGGKVTATRRFILN